MAVLNWIFRRCHVKVASETWCSDMTNSEFYRRIAKMLSYADQHPDLEAARRGQKAQDEYHAHIIREYNIGATTYVCTTALNLDIENLIKKIQN